MELIILLSLILLFFLIKIVSTVLKGVSFIFGAQSPRQDGRQYYNSSYTNNDKETADDHKKGQGSGKIFGQNEGKYIAFEEIEERG